MDLNMWPPLPPSPSATKHLSTERESEGSSSTRNGPGLLWEEPLGRNEDLHTANMPHLLVSATGDFSPNSGMTRNERNSILQANRPERLLNHNQVFPELTNFHAADLPQCPPSHQTLLRNNLQHPRDYTLRQALRWLFPAGTSQQGSCETHPPTAFTRMGRGTSSTPVTNGPQFSFQEMVLMDLERQQTAATIAILEGRSPW